MSADSARAAAEPAASSAEPVRQRGWHRRFGTRLRHSLRLKLIALFVLFALLMSAVFVSGMQRAFSSGWRELARPILIDYVNRLVTEIGAPPDVGRAQALADRLPIAVRISGPIVNWNSVSDEDAGPSRRWRRRTDADTEHDAVALLTRETADGHRIAFMVRGELPWRSRPHRIGLITLALLLLLLAGAYLLIRRMLRPIHQIAAGAERYGAGDFSQPIPVRRRDELGNLAARVNASAQQLQQMLDAKRALLLAMSHELRSPLTRVRLNVELLPAPHSASDPAQDRLRAALLRDIGEMRALIDALLESERLGNGHAALHRTMTDPGALVRAVVDEMTRQHAVEAAAGAELQPTPQPTATATPMPMPMPMPMPNIVELQIAPSLPHAALDSTRLRVLLRNLIDNALRHGTVAGRLPQVGLRSELAGADDHAAAWLILTVRDFGPGVDEALLPQLGEPFFRTDAARGRATGGVGLGLHLCRLITQAHGGTLAVRNARPGLEWVVRLPV